MHTSEVADYLPAATAAFSPFHACGQANGQAEVNSGSPAYTEKDDEYSGRDPNRFPSIQENLGKNSSPINAAASTARNNPQF